MHWLCIVTTWSTGKKYPLQAYKMNRKNRILSLLYEPFLWTADISYENNCQQCFWGFMIKSNNSWFIYLGKAETVIITKTGQETTPGSSRRTTPSRTPSSEETGVEGIFFNLLKFLYLFLLIFIRSSMYILLGWCFSFISNTSILRGKIFCYLSMCHNTWALAQLGVGFWETSK